MKLTSSFFVSVTLHALALAYPVSFSRAKPHELIEVTVLSVDHDSSAAFTAAKSNTTSSRSSALRSAALRSSLKPRPALPRSTNAGLTPQSPSVTIPPDASQDSMAASTLLLSIPVEAQIETSLEKSSAGHGIGGNDGSRQDYANGSGETGMGVGQDSNGGGGAATLSQARYRETPKPKYPESARRNGREGTVLLRVLVDDQGRAKIVEINQSSGDDALDHAAREAIQRWRFIPARNADRSVESWIRIPVNFHIAEINSR